MMSAALLVVMSLDEVPPAIVAIMTTARSVLVALFDYDNLG